MHEYDVALKLTLQQGDLVMRALTGHPIAHWLNVELPEVRNTRVDLLGETDTGELVHIELQSSNDLRMPLRMAEYCLQVYRRLNRFPQQVLVYIGEAPLNMAAELHGPSLRYSYRLVDIRELDGERLLQSPSVGDNILAILTRVPDIRAAMHQVMERIAELAPGEREAALAQLVILAGLRKLGYLIEEEAQSMPILNDILDHDLLGPTFQRGVEQGLQKGLQQGAEQGLQKGLQQGVEQGLQQGVAQGLQKGLQQGELTVLRRQLVKRFGAIPTWAEERLARLSPPELEDLGVRLLDAASFEDLLR